MVTYRIIIINCPSGPVARVPPYAACDWSRHTRQSAGVPGLLSFETRQQRCWPAQSPSCGAKSDEVMRNCARSLRTARRLPVRDPRPN